MLWLYAQRAQCMGGGWTDIDFRREVEQFTNVTARVSLPKHRQSQMQASRGQGHQGGRVLVPASAFMSR